MIVTVAVVTENLILLSINFLNFYLIYSNLFLYYKDRIF
ncbi:hypothetical protein SDC9_97860 [bioreactor metagenome]|uniref:Uncharacterized protein n=1 Tax=bioreactor metagenome TaxID=1076179 RepID=A0A645AJS4_9ZZZZ